MNGFQEFLTTYKIPILLVFSIITFLIIVEVIDVLIKKLGKNSKIILESDNDDEINSSTNQKIREYEEKIAYLESRIIELESVVSNSKITSQNDVIDEEPIVEFIKIEEVKSETQKAPVPKIIKTIDLAAPESEEAEDISITSDLNALVEEIKSNQNKQIDVEEKQVKVDTQDENSSLNINETEKVPYVKSVTEIQLPERLIQLKKVVQDKVSKCTSDLERVKENNGTEHEREEILEELIKAKSVFDEYKKLEKQFLEKNKNN